MISILLLLPVLLGLIVLFVKTKWLTRTSLLIVPTVYLVVVILRLYGIEWIILPNWAQLYFSFDSIGTFFLTIMSIVFVVTAIYSLFYFNEHQLSPQQEATYTIII